MRGSSTKRCPGPAEMARAVSEGPSERLRRHLAECPACASEWQASVRLVDLARELPAKLPGNDRIEEVRTELLAAAGTAAQRRIPARRRAYAVATQSVAALAVAAGLWFFFAGTGGDGGASRSVPRAGTATTAAAPLGPVAVVHHGTIHSHPGARFVRAGTAPDEVVRLTEGTLTVEVTPLGPGERFRLLTGDAEVEVRGTMFEAQARDDRLVAVTVLHGRVEVRPTGGRLAVLGPREEWTAPTRIARNESPAATPGPDDGLAPTTAEPVSVASPPEPAVIPSLPAPSRRQHPPEFQAVAMGAAARNDTPTSALESQPVEALFDEGWRALTTGDAERAMDAFGRAEASAPASPMAEDALFWRAVAAQRAGRPAYARDALTGFLDRWPASPRAGSAAVMLGWLLLDAGDLDQAEARFRDATRDPAPDVQENATNGLAAVESARGSR